VGRHASGFPAPLIVLPTPWTIAVPDEIDTQVCNSLNSDPFNLRAEELAMKDCTLGVEVRRTWSEKEMVRSIEGRLFAGTPDGMFEDWNGALTCVQVVRVPLLSESVESMQSTLAETIISKVVKSQQWLRASPFKPDQFIIFCWLPFTVPEIVAEHGESVMSKVKQLDSRFSLRLRLPADPDSLFPALFASNKVKKIFNYSWSDVATFPSTQDDESDEECFAWDWSEDGVDMPKDSDLLSTSCDEVASEREVEDFDHVWDDLEDNVCFQEVTNNNSSGCIRASDCRDSTSACGICIEKILIDNG